MEEPNQQSGSNRSVSQNLQKAHAVWRATRLAPAWALIAIVYVILLMVLIPSADGLIELFFMLAIALSVAGVAATKEFLALGSAVRSAWDAQVPQSRHGDTVRERLLRSPDGGQSVASPSHDAYSVDSEDVRGWLSPWPAVFLEQLPAAFTALGILFTFVGLVRGIGVIDPTGGSDELQGAIGGLLGGLGIAFESSIIGISLSLYTLAVTRWATHRVERDCATFRHVTAEGWPLLAPETLLQEMADLQRAAVQQNKRMLDLAQSQKESISQLASDMAGQVSAQLGQIIESSLGDPLRSMESSFGAFADSETSMHASALDSVMNTFASTFSETLAGRFQQLETVLTKLVEWHEATSERYNQTWQQLGAHVDAHSKQLNEERAHFEIRSSAELSASRSQAEFANRLESVVTEVVRIGAELKTFEEGLRGLTTAQVRAQQGIGGASTAISETQASLVDGLTMMRRALDTAAGPLVTQYERLLGDIQSQLRDGLTESFGQFDRETAKVVSHLGGTFAHMQEMLERMERLPANLQHRQ